MDTYGINRRDIIAGQWNGEDGTVTEWLTANGFRYLIQEPECDTEQVWDSEDDDDNPREVPARRQLVIVGKFQGEIWHMRSGEYLVLTQGRTRRLRKIRNRTSPYTFSVWSASHVEENYTKATVTPA